MPFPDRIDEFRETIPDLRGRLAANQPLAPFTWFRTGGPAEILFSPADEEDLTYFLQKLSSDVPVTVIGLGSNLIVRDGGIPGAVIRLGGKLFGEIGIQDDAHLRVGAAVPDMHLARTAADAGIGGFAFFRGIPGTIGGALRMNAGAHDGETSRCLVAAHGVDWKGNLHIFTGADMGFEYRHCGVPDDIIFTHAFLRGEPAEPAKIHEEMERITQAREAAQPIRDKTGGSTFKNPPGYKAWKVIEEAGCRGLVVGDAQVSEKHCNFLINRGNATSADIEALGEEVRMRVRRTSGIELEWEIKRVGVLL